MKLKITLLFIVMIYLYSCKENDPYSEGMHWNYSIICNDGFKYKCLDHNRGTIPCLNSDGTQLKCDKKRY